MLLRRSIYLLALCGSAAVLAGQTPPGASAAQPLNIAPPAPDALPSATMQPSLDVLKTALSIVRVDRWKASGAIRSEAESNVASVQRDLDATLPSLLATADTAPGSAAKVLPVYRNVEALYDVMLRVDAAARLAAPGDQMSVIDQALAQLDNGRRALGDQLQQSTDAQERQVIHLQAALKAIPPPPPPMPPPALTPVKCPVTPVRKRRPAAKPATTAKSTTAPPATSQNPATPPH